jgi:hypothetical protein
MARTTDTVEAIQASLEQLVSQRQTLRASAAEPALLERNRLEIARFQQLLSEALIKKHSRIAA